MLQFQPIPQPTFRTACGGKITNPDDYPLAEYQGERVIFCTLGCLHAFEAVPEAFMAGEVEHPAG